MEKFNKKSLKDLIDNAFDFLEKAINDFQTAPKYSVINFCAAVELMLKARLMKEHWSLIISSKNHPSLAEFKSGNFRSINFSELIPRIESVSGEVIPKEASTCFNQLADHRNKMIHFFHEAHSTLNSKLLEEIAIEQCSGWFYLRRLLDNWQGIFGEYDERIENINASMKIHDVYLSTVFDRITPEIEQAKKLGIVFTPCQRCKKNASEERKISEFLNTYRCRVCLFSDQALHVECPEEDCDTVIQIEEDNPLVIECPACQCKVTTDELGEMLDTDPVTHDNYFEHENKNCAMCHGLDTVVTHYDFFICTECGHVSDEISRCEHCSELQMGGGDLEFSKYSGCEFCDGHRDWRD